MVEPNRKKRKHVSVRVVDEIAGAAIDSDPVEKAFSEFAVGRNETRISNARWRGPFKGRPELFEELLPHIKKRIATKGDGRRKRDRSIEAYKTSLRAWWRLLDQYDEEFPVRSVLDLDDIHGALQMRNGMPASYTDYFLMVVNDARVQLGMPRLFWPRNDAERPLIDVPLLSQVRPVYHALKHEVRAMFQRWEQADGLAATGKNWDGRESCRAQNEEWTEADVHATYRGLSQRLGHPCPSIDTCRESVERPFGQLTLRTPIAVFGRFPSRDDIQACFFIFLLRTGWNASVALNIDVEKESAWFRPHPTSARHHVVFAIKERGMTEQIAIGLTRSELSPGTLIHSLLARTEALRALLRKELSELLERPLTPVGSRRIEEVRTLLRSPWLYVHSRKHYEIRALDSRSYALESRGKSRLGTIIQRLNKSRPEGDQIPHMTPTDFRDAYISYAYQYSGYSWLIAQLAAGHKSVESLKSYLRTRRLKAHGENQLRKLGNAMWDEIRIHRILDAAILFAMVQRGEITPEQRARWLAFKDRTRVGMGCRDFYHPPNSIVPHHEDGAGCRVQRCVLCEHGILFDDSLNYLCRRYAELRHLQTELPLVTWLESSFSDEFELTEVVLERNFNHERITHTIQAWDEEIASGRHRVMSMEGEYGTICAT
jgi:integrase